MRFPPPSFPDLYFFLDHWDQFLKEIKRVVGNSTPGFYQNASSAPGWSLPVWPFLSAGAPSELCSVLCCIDTSNRGNRGESDARVSQREKKSLLSLSFPPLQAAGWLMFRAVFLIPGLSSSCRRRLSLYGTFSGPFSPHCHRSATIFPMFFFCLISVAEKSKSIKFPGQ